MKMQKQAYEDFRAVLIGALNAAHAAPEGTKKVFDVEADYPEVKRLHGVCMRAESNYDVYNRQTDIVISTVVPCDAVTMGGGKVPDFYIMCLEGLKNEDLRDTTPDKFCRMIGERMVLDAVEMFTTGEIKEEHYNLVRASTRRESGKRRMGRDLDVPGLVLRPRHDERMLGLH